MPKPPKPVKPKKKATGALVVALLFMLLILVTAGMVYFDMGGMKDTAVAVFRLDNPTQQQLALLEQKEQSLDAREKAVAAAEDEQKAKLKDIKAREKAITGKEDAVTEREKAIGDMQKQIDDLKAQLNIKTIDISTAVQRFAVMEPKKAAKAMDGMQDPAQIATLLLYMDSDKSAAILNEMKPALVTSVMTEIAKMKTPEEIVQGSQGTPPSGEQPLQAANDTSGT